MSGQLNTAFTSTEFNKEGDLSSPYNAENSLVNVTAKHSGYDRTFFFYNFFIENSVSNRSL